MLINNTAIDLNVAGGYQNNISRRYRRRSVSSECYNFEPLAETGPVQLHPKSNEDMENIRYAMEHSFLFQGLGEHDKQLICDAMSRKTVEQDFVIISQGAEGDYFYILDEGHCDVYVNKSKVLEYRAGSYAEVSNPSIDEKNVCSFGELALMYNCPRAATVIAASNCMLWVIERQVFRQIIAGRVVERVQTQTKDRKLSSNWQRVRRTSISAECVGQNLEIEAQPKDIGTTDRILKVMRDNFIFNTLDEKDQIAACTAMRRTEIDDDSVIVAQGSKGDFFYIVEEGHCDVFVNNVKVSECRSQSDCALQTAASTNFKLMSSFGELALMYNCPHSATVISRSKCVLWELDRKSFRQIIYNRYEDQRRTRDVFLSQCELFSGLNRSEIAKISDAMTEERFPDGALVVKQGDEKYESMKFYLIMQGAAEAFKIRRTDVNVDSSSPGVSTEFNKNGVLDPAFQFHSSNSMETSEVKVGFIAVGGFFGEKALVEKVPRAASVRAIGDLVCGVLDVASFERLLGNCNDLLNRHISKYRKINQVLKFGIWSPSDSDYASGTNA